VPAFLVAACFAIVALLLSSTGLGRSFYAIGGNRTAARLAGLSIRRTVMAAYVFSGVMAGIAGLIAASRTEAGSPIIGSGWELQSIAIVILGGASLFGGSGGAVGTLLAGCLLGEIDNWMSLQNYADWVQELVQGALLITVVALAARRWRSRSRFRSEATLEAAVPS
jgi:ribose transport system permease protein